MIYDDIQRLIRYALKNELIAQEDIYVIRNQLMEVFQLTGFCTLLQSEERYEKI